MNTSRLACLWICCLMRGVVTTEEQHSWRKQWRKRLVRGKANVKALTLMHSRYAQCQNTDVITCNYKWSLNIAGNTGLGMLDKATFRCLVIDTHTTRLARGLDLTLYFPSRLAAVSNVTHVTSFYQSTSISCPSSNLQVQNLLLI